MPREQATNLLGFFNQSKSQLRQDLFVLAMTGFKKNGFFVEFGATNGLKLSNTWLLEKGFGWDGILAEPGKCWHQDLKHNRSVKIDYRCVWKETGTTLRFKEVEDAELSTIETYGDEDHHKNLRKNSKAYDVLSVSLNDLLEEHQAPQEIDYLSIDTEGSELDILNNFDFSRHSFKIITCEHNYLSAREDIHRLLLNNGYERMFVDISKFDDWYVRSR